MKEPITYISKKTYYTLIPRILRKHGGTLKVKTLDGMVKSCLLDRFSKEDLKKIETGFGRIPRWKRVMAFAKVDLLKHRLVVQVHGMAVNMECCRFPSLQRLALKKIDAYLLEPSMPPKIKKTIKGSSVDLKVAV